MEIWLAPRFPVACVALLALFLVLGVGLFHRSPPNALVGAALLVLLHWVSETWHNFGHFTGARRTGFPMEGVRLGTALLVFGTSVYPADEQPVSAAVHVQRALGGPISNIILGGLGLVLTLVLSSLRSPFTWVGVVFTLENLLVFVVGNFVPLGFNDGSTLRYWWPRR
ncbi:MAG: hypothetical protein NVSMB17_07370 [Candidatus Dormibacteria bacterium]